MYFFVPCSACRKDVFKRKAWFQALSKHYDEKWICLILGVLIIIISINYLSVPHYSQTLETVSNLEVSTELY